MCVTENAGMHSGFICLRYTLTAGVYVEEGPDRDALTAALARENYLPVYLDPRTVSLSLDLP